MTRRTTILGALCLAALLACPGTNALAKASQEMPAQTGQPEAPAGQTQGQPAASPQPAAALARTVQAVTQHNQATAAAAAQAEAQMNPTPAAPAQKAGSGKAIYGDIIIHK